MELVKVKSFFEIFVNIEISLKEEVRKEVFSISLNIRLFEGWVQLTQCPDCLGKFYHQNQHHLSATYSEIALNCNLDQSLNNKQSQHTWWTGCFGIQTLNSMLQFEMFCNSSPLKLSNLLVLFRHLSNKPVVLSHSKIK